MSNKELIEGVVHQMLVDYVDESVGETIEVSFAKELMVKMAQHQAKTMYNDEEVQVKLYECLGHFAQKHNIIINGNEIDEWFNKHKKQ